ncbi:nicotinate (nicotinamide) nucleotide adenylyltransferase [Anaerococcus sp. Marseille-P3915]|uniref:nicotinate (nicotinamide) nucleotide adenylyltransferase n=1 Tax=Anaerococcus sp. Marseille-P3915 TaxID=2057799 RepID=UPI000D0B0FD9|nr:nicotinate (nicotinamide) nucleotide adenylyltransferase [Anaerococcus sp. Marseille-P3915]
MRIGLYGGTFDPIHLGHLIVMENVINYMNLDRIIILPSSNPPHKKDKKITEVNTRVEMVSEAIKDNDKIILSTFESTDQVIRYTHDTIKYFTDSLKEHEIFYIMGEDSFMTIDTWKNYKYILDSNIIVFSREGIDPHSKLVDKVKKIRKDNPNIFLVNSLSINISSTLIRSLVKDEKSIKYLVKDEVDYIIKQRNLYA